MRGWSIEVVTGVKPAFTDKMQRLSAQWREQQEAARLDAAIAANLEYLGFAQ